jgi:hypothetical protein
LSAFQAGLQSIQETLATAVAKPSAPAVSIDLTPLGRELEALRASVDTRLNQALGQPAKKKDDARELSVALGEGLNALRSDLSRAITAVHTGTMAEKVQSLSHELEMIHSTLATLKDLAEQQRNHLREAQELLATRARQGTVEIDLTQEMLTNERAFLEKFHQALEQSASEQPAAGEAKPGESPDGSKGAL